MHTEEVEQYPHPAIVITDNIELIKKIDQARSVLGISLLCDLLQTGQQALNNLLEFDPIKEVETFKDLHAMASYMSKAQPLANGSPHLANILTIVLWLKSHTGHSYLDINNWLEGEQYDILFKLLEQQASNPEYIQLKAGLQYFTQQSSEDQLVATEICISIFNSLATLPKMDTSKEMDLLPLATTVYLFYPSEHEEANSPFFNSCLYVLMQKIQDTRKNPILIATTKSLSLTPILLTLPDFDDKKFTPQLLL